MDMKSKFVTLLSVGLVLLPSVEGLSPCFDPTNVEYRCAAGTEIIRLPGFQCGQLLDEDFPDFLSCFESAGKSNVKTIDLTTSYFSTFPVGMFEGLTSLESLKLQSFNVESYDPELFQEVSTTLKELRLLSSDKVAFIPETLFNNLFGLTYVSIFSCELITSVPVNLFKDNTALETVNLAYNSLTALPLGLFDGLSSVTSLPLQANDFTTLPAGIFEPLVSLEKLFLKTVLNLQCLPASTATAIALFSESIRDGTCECVAGVSVCDEGLFCSPGTEGYTCGTTSTAPVTTPTPVVTLEPVATTTYTSTFDDDYFYEDSNSLEAMSQASSGAQDEATETGETVNGAEGARMPLHVALGACVLGVLTAAFAW